MKPKESMEVMLARRELLMADLLPENREVVKLATEYVAEMHCAHIKALLGMSKRGQVPHARMILTGLLRRHAPSLSHPMMATLYGGNQSTYSRVGSLWRDYGGSESVLTHFDDWREKRLDKPTEAVSQCAHDQA